MKLSRQVMRKFAYLCFLCWADGNIVFDILEPPGFVLNMAYVRSLKQFFICVLVSTMSMSSMSMSTMPMGPTNIDDSTGSSH